MQRKLVATFSLSQSRSAYVLQSPLKDFLRVMLTSVPKPTGAEKAINILGDANDYEKKLLEKCISGLKGNIQKGIEFVANPPPSKK